VQEKISLTLQVNGANAQISGLSSAGLVLYRETSTTPRGLNFLLEPGNAITEYRMRRVRQIQDCHLGELLAPGKTDHLKLAATLAQGATADFMYYKVVKAVG
jgi:hypothetical protein